MNAKELFEIVKDVPREWWPEDTGYDSDAQVWINTDDQYPIHHPELCFEASMMRWLCRKLMASKGMPHVSVVAPEDGEDRWRIFKSTRTHCIAVENTLVEVLAAACKAVGK